MGREGNGEGEEWGGMVSLPATGLWLASHLCLLEEFHHPSCRNSWNRIR